MLPMCVTSFLTRSRDKRLGVVVHSRRRSRSNRQAPFWNFASLDWVVLWDFCGVFCEVEILM